MVKRYRVVMEDGRSFSAVKGSTLKELVKWKGSINKQSKYKVSAIVPAKERSSPIKKAIKQKMGYSMAEIMRM